MLPVDPTDTPGLTFDVTSPLAEPTDSAYWTSPFVSKLTVAARPADSCTVPNWVAVAPIPFWTEMFSPPRTTYVPPTGVGAAWGAKVGVAPAVTVTFPAAPATGLPAPSTMPKVIEPVPGPAKVRKLSTSASDAYRPDASRPAAFICALAPNTTPLMFSSHTWPLAVSLPSNVVAPPEMRLSATAFEFGCAKLTTSVETVLKLVQSMATLGTF